MHEYNTRGKTQSCPSWLAQKSYYQNNRTASYEKGARPGSESRPYVQAASNLVPCFYAQSRPYLRRKHLIAPTRPEPGVGRCLPCPCGLGRPGSLPGLVYVQAYTAVLPQLDPEMTLPRERPPPILRASHPAGQTLLSPASSPGSEARSSRPSASPYRSASCSGSSRAPSCRTMGTQSR
jgi:hypothetical protein